MVFNTGPYTVLPDNSILNTANMQSETGFSSSHQLKSYVAFKSSLKLAVRAVLSAGAGLLVNTASMQSEMGFPSSHQLKTYVASKSRLKLAARTVLSADAGLLVIFYLYHLCEGLSTMKAVMAQCNGMYRI